VKERGVGPHLRRRRHADGPSRHGPSTTRARTRRSIAIDLTNERYKQIIVQVDGEAPEEAARRIEAAITG
jgi:hypothetical protein